MPIYELAAYPKMCGNPRKLYGNSKAAKTYAERKAQARTTCCNAVRWWRGHPGLNEDSESSQLQWHRLLPLQRLHPLQAMLVFLGLKTSFFSIYATDAATIIPTTIYCSITESLR
jgi:hypothetical protein